MREQNPQRHGPYYKLAYVRRGHPVCRFVREGCVDQVTQRVAMYKTFRNLIDRWIDLSIQRGVQEFFASGPSQKLAVVKRTRRTSSPKNVAL